MSVSGKELKFLHEEMETCNRRQELTSTRV